MSEWRHSHTFCIRMPILSSRPLPAERRTEAHSATAPGNPEGPARQDELHALAVALDVHDDVFAVYAAGRAALLQQVVQQLRIETLARESELPELLGVDEAPGAIPMHWLWIQRSGNEETRH